MTTGIHSQKLFTTTLARCLLRSSGSSLMIYWILFCSISCTRSLLSHSRLSSYLVSAPSCQPRKPNLFSITAPPSQQTLRD